MSFRDASLCQQIAAAHHDLVRNVRLLRTTLNRALQGVADPSLVLPGLLAAFEQVVRLETLAAVARDVCEDRRRLSRMLRDVQMDLGDGRSALAETSAFLLQNDAPDLAVGAEDEEDDVYVPDGEVLACGDSNDVDGGGGSCNA